MTWGVVRVLGKVQAMPVAGSSGTAHIQLPAVLYLELWGRQRNVCSMMCHLAGQCGTSVWSPVAGCGASTDCIFATQAVWCRFGVWR
jgi:hypothetical protein